VNSFAPKTRSRNASTPTNDNGTGEETLAEKTLKQHHAEWRAALDELAAFEQRLGVVLQEMNAKEVPAPSLRLTTEDVGELLRLVEKERRLANAYRTAQVDELGRQISDEVGLRAREQAVADDDGMSQVHSA
jgi:hypothetical protein